MGHFGALHPGRCVADRYQTLQVQFLARRVRSCTASIVVGQHRETGGRTGLGRLLAAKVLLEYVVRHQLGERFLVLALVGHGQQFVPVEVEIDLEGI